jgi:iron(III) transport system ATP-binding protein
MPNKMPLALSIQHMLLMREQQLILDALTLQLAAGEIGCLLGPSGCGKTTLLRAIAGFESINQGCINIAGTCVASMIGLVLVKWLEARSTYNR